MKIATPFLLQWNCALLHTQEGENIYIAKYIVRFTPIQYNKKEIGKESFFCFGDLRGQLACPRATLCTELCHSDSD